jgi:hypothetical protein
MENAHDSAFPTEQPVEWIQTLDDESTRSPSRYAFVGGLTKREYAAIGILAGLCSEVMSVNSKHGTPSGIDKTLAQIAVAMADSLFAELERTK